jgi:hypothetical protein
MSSTKRSAKGPLYHKNGKVGDIIHSKACLVLVEASAKRYYGDIWKDKWISGQINHIGKVLLNGSDQLMYTSVYKLPGLNTVEKQLRAIQCLPGVHKDKQAQRHFSLLGEESPQREPSPPVDDQAESVATSVLLRNCGFIKPADTGPTSPYVPTGNSEATSVLNRRLDMIANRPTVRANTDEAVDEEMRVMANHYCQGQATYTPESNEWPSPDESPNLLAGGDSELSSCSETQDYSPPVRPTRVTAVNLTYESPAAVVATISPPVAEVVGSQTTTKYEQI